MEQQSVVEILANILVTSEKWRTEVESNIMLQNTLEELFADPVFQQILEKGLVPKYQRTYVPHFRAVEMSCAVREVVRQMYEEGGDHSQVELRFEEFQLKVSDKFNPGVEIDVRGSLDSALAEAARLEQLYRKDPQFSARLDMFRLLVLPLSVQQADDTRYQLLVLENIRPPRQAWASAR